MRSMPLGDRWISLLCGANSPESFVHLIGVSDLPSDQIIGAPIVVTLDYMRLMTVWAPPNCWTARSRWSLIRHAPTFNVFIRRGYTALMDGRHSLRRQSLIIAHCANCCLGISLVLHNKAPRKTASRSPSDSMFAPSLRDYRAWRPNDFRFKNINFSNLEKNCSFRIKFICLTKWYFVSTAGTLFRSRVAAAEALLSVIVYERKYLSLCFQVNDSTFLLVPNPSLKYPREVLAHFKSRRYKPTRWQNYYRKHCRCHLNNTY